MQDPSYRLTFILNVILLFGISLSSCKQRSKSIYNGHWHQITSYGHIKTLDINDTFAIQNKYSADYGGIKYPRLNENDKPIFPTTTYLVSDQIKLTNDTIVINDSLFTYRYVRGHLSACLLIHHYADLCMKTMKEKKPTQTSTDWIHQYCREDMFVNSIQNEVGYFDSLSSAFPDSVFLKVKEIIDTEKLSAVYQFNKNTCFNDLLINQHILESQQKSEEFIRKMLRSNTIQ